MQVIYGAWECSRCGQKGKLPTTADGNWSSNDDNARFVKEHLDQCFTAAELAEGIGPEQFFVGTLTIRSA